MGQQNYFLLDQQCFKTFGPALAHYWHANPPFANGLNNLATMAQLYVLLGWEALKFCFFQNSLDSHIVTSVAWNIRIIRHDIDVISVIIPH